MSILEVFLSLDIYGKNPVLKIGNRSSMQTYFGSVISLLTFLLGFALFLYFGIQAILKQNPRIVLSVINVDNPLPVYLSQNNFSFALGLSDPFTKNQFIDETIYTLSVNLATGNRIRINGTTAFKWNYQNFDVARCNVSNFPVSYQDAFSKLPLPNMYCIKDIPYSLFGKFANEAYSSLVLNLVECVNSTANNNTCKDKVVIDKYLVGAFLGLFYTDISIDPLNITYPNQIAMGNTYTSISNKRFTEIHQYMKPIKILSDNGFIFEDKQTNNFLQSDKYLIFNDFTPAVKFVTIKISLSNQFDIYQRSYTKAQDVAAQIGGMLNFLTTCGFILSYFYTDIKFNELLVNQLYGFEFGKRGKKGENGDKKIEIIEKNVKLQVNKEILILNKDLSADQISENKSKILSHSTKLNQNKKNKMTILEYVKKKNNCTNLEITIIESIKLFFCFSCMRNQPKIKFMKQATEIVYKKLDMINLLNCFDDLDRIKYLLLDKKQILLFDYLPKRHINDYILSEHDEDNDLKQDIGLKRKLSNKMQLFFSKNETKHINEDNIDTDIVNAFNEIKEKSNSNNSTKLDKKLVELYED